MIPLSSFLGRGIRGEGVEGLYNIKSISTRILNFRLDLYFQNIALIHFRIIRN